jgi:hypothetical protein
MVMVATRSATSTRSVVRSSRPVTA